MRKGVDRKFVMLPMLKIFCVFTLEVLLHPVIEVKILNLTGIEDFMLENYSCCSSLNLFTFQKFHYASVQKILARYLAENSELCLLWTHSRLQGLNSSNDYSQAPQKCVSLRDLSVDKVQRRKQINLNAV